MIEKKLARTSFIWSNIYFILYLKYEIIQSNIFKIALYLLIFSCIVLVISYTQRWKNLLLYILGVLSFLVILNSIYLAGSRGLGTGTIHSALTRIVVSIILIWKLQTDTRYADIKVFEKPRHTLLQRFVIVPIQRLYRFSVLLAYITYCFYLMISALRVLSSNDVDPEFYDELKGLVINLLFIVVQTPLLINQRKSLTGKISNFLDNMDWMRTLHTDMPDSYQEQMNSNLNLSQIDSGSRHIWLSVIFLLVLRAYEDVIVALVDGVILDFLLDFLL